MISRPHYLLGLSLTALLCVDSTAATTPAASAPANRLPQFGRQFVDELKNFVDELKKPEYAVSRCALTPVFATDNMTVAVSVDRVFSAGDVVIAVGDEKVDVSAKTAVRDLLMKHGANESILIKIRRADKEQVITAKCMDAKPYYDLILEAAYAASKNDAATCADKMNAVRSLHALYSSLMYLAYECTDIARRLTPNDQAHGFYDVNRELILENEWSSDALSNIRGQILNAVDLLQKNNASLLGDDLRQQYEQALAAAKSTPATAASNAR